MLKNCNIRFLLLFSITAILPSHGYSIEPGEFYADGKKHHQAVALTFDDGPGKTTMEILNLLDQYKVKATFFMNGSQVKRFPDLAREVAARGHEIGDHTYHHKNFYSMQKSMGIEETKNEIRSEMQKSKKLIEEVTGLSLRLCRMPNGYSRSWVRELAKEFGYTLVNWTYGIDWKKMKMERMIKGYTSHNVPGAILLFHDGGRRRSNTLQALPAIIKDARDKGLDFMTVSEILKE